MATIAEQRAALSTVLASKGLTLAPSWGGEPPYVLMFLNGSDFAIMPNGQTSLDFRLTLVVARALDDVSTVEVEDLVMDMVSAVYSLSGWSLNGLSPMQMRTIGGSEMPTVDLTISALVGIP